MFEKVQPGQPFKPSARVHNAFVDVLNGPNAISGLRGLVGLGADGARVKNGTGAAIGRFNVLTLGNLNMESSEDVASFLDNLVVKAAKPVTADYSRDKRIGITIDGIDDEGIGLVVTDGLVPCQIEVTDVLHKYARPTDGDCTKLTSDWWGQCRIVSSQSGTGTKWAIVQVGNYFDHSYIGKFISDVGDEDTGTITVWSGIGAGSIATTGTIEEVYNRYAELLEADKFARVSWDNDGPECVAIRCA